ncbi:929_t:CDS:1, partial [Dentiscutata heterogama]
VSSSINKNNPLMASKTNSIAMMQFSCNASNNRGQPLADI